MVGFNIKVTGVNKLTRDLTIFDNWLTVKLPNLTKKEAIDGSRLLIGLMPKQTGAMVQAVSVVPKAKQWAIISRTPKRGGLQRPYHVWYNDGKRGWYKSGRKRSGQYHYYETTYNYLNDNYPRKVLKDLKQVLQS